jgi:hypothetical protein
VKIGFYLSDLVTASPTTSFQSLSHYFDVSGTKLYDIRNCLSYRSGGSGRSALWPLTMIRPRAPGLNAH